MPNALPATRDTGARIAQRVVAELRVQVGEHREDRVVHEADGVAVGRGARDALGADLARGARLVLDTIGCPRLSDIFAAITRATVSTAVPACSGTIMRIGFAG
jgi:hypothetical protein